MDDERQVLYRQLGSPDLRTRQEATQRLWQLYFGAAGPEAEIRLLQAEQAIETGSYEAAQAWLDNLVADFPEFAEAWNRRATVYYLLKNYNASLADCQAALKLESNHFGAWHGMGLNYLALKRYADAARAFRRALELQPFAERNQQLLAECLTKLN